MQLLVSRVLSRVSAHNVVSTNTELLRPFVSSMRVLQGPINWRITQPHSPVFMYDMIGPTTGSPSCMLLSCWIYVIHLIGCVSIAEKKLNMICAIDYVPAGANQGSLVKGNRKLARSLD